MRTCAYVVAATLAALCAFGNLALGQNPGGTGPDGYPLPGGFHPDAVMAISDSLPPGAPITLASAEGPLAAPVIPSMETDDDEVIAVYSKGGGKGGKYQHRPPRLAFYGDFLYLRPRDAEVAFAVPVDGPVVAPPNNFPIQVAPVGVVDMDYQPGFRAGFRYNLNARSAFGAEYTFFEGNTANSVATQAGDVVRSIVSHPGTQAASQDYLLANAEYDLSYDIADVNYYNLLSYSDDYRLMMLAGLRLMQSEQNLQVDFAGTGTQTVMTDVDFYGAGARIGLEFDKFIGSQWLVYAKGYASLIPGEFSADYDQSQSFDSVVVDTGWKAGRLITIWDLELGLGWISNCGTYRFNAGYTFSAWTNMVQTDEWIAAVQQNNYIGMDSTTTYDGLTARFEIRY
ncbi:MAG: Lpg1974 family pore-forming outer membrane protein [Pirellulaceae bacterium]